LAIDTILSLKHAKPHEVTGKFQWIADWLAMDR
jgi:hypothetical protein